MPWTLNGPLRSIRAGVGRSGSQNNQAIDHYLLIRFSIHLESKSSPPLDVILAAKIVNVRLRKTNRSSESQLRYIPQPAQGSSDSVPLRTGALTL